MQIFLAVFGRFREGTFGHFPSSEKILGHIAGLSFDQIKGLLIDFGHGDAVRHVEVPVLKRAEKRLDVADRQKVLQVININEQKQMFPRILLLLRRGKKFVLRVVVDHGFGQDLVVGISLAGRQLGVHKSCDLVHIQRNIRDIFRGYIADLLELFHDCSQHVPCCFVHI